MRKICVVSGTRAEYGLLYWLMRGILSEADLHLQIIATGMHLSPEYGMTYRLIEEDGFAIEEKIEILLSSDTPVGIAKSIGLGVVGFADALARLRPDILVVLGDRYEILAAVQAALFARIPVAHIHGGETTEGAADEAIRHAVTKMSHLHFVAAEAYRKRVVQLGEQPATVFNVGSVGLENINRLRLLDREQFEQSIGFKLGDVNFLVTYHPATLGVIAPGDAMKEILTALEKFPDARLIFTKPNSDTGGRIIGQLIDEYVDRHAGRAVAFTSMGQIRYLSAMRHAQVVIGNSSSGIIEAPVFKKATVNIGDRQTGRLKAVSILDCNEQADEIALCIKKVLSPEFSETLENVESLYGTGKSSEQILEVLKTVPLEGLTKKRFHDL